MDKIASVCTTNNGRKSEEEKFPQILSTSKSSHRTGDTNSDCDIIQVVCEMPTQTHARLHKTIRSSKNSSHSCAELIIVQIFKIRFFSFQQQHLPCSPTFAVPQTSTPIILFAFAFRSFSQHRSFSFFLFSSFLSPPHSNSSSSSESLFEKCQKNLSPPAKEK